MERKVTTISVLMAGVFLLFVVGGYGDEPTQAAGQALFEQYKCNKCHKIEKETAPTETEATPQDAWGMGGGGVQAAPSGPPNLWDVGSRITDADWLSKYLLKEVDKEGASHKMKFKGSAEELATLTQWLLSHKGEAADTLKAIQTEPTPEPQAEPQSGE